MAEILSKYSNTLTLEASASLGERDTRSPYSYTEWLERNIGIIDGKEREQYTQYINSWYITRDEVQINNTEQLKEDYKALLQQISLTFGVEEAPLITDINFDDPIELEQVIPFYSKKLKDIAVYFINKREAVKKSKLKYNMAGAKTALESVFYEYLLKSFTNNSGSNFSQLAVTSTSALQALPDLSAAISTFQINVEELYDDSTYFDRDPTMDVTEYFNLSTEDVVSYLNDLNISSDEYEWLYSTGVSQLCADNPMFWAMDDIINQYKSGLPLSAVESYNSPILNEYNKINLTKKYLGSNQNWISGGYYEDWKQDLEFNINEGNNWFYWLSGEHIHEVPDRYVDPIALSATTLIESGATGGSQYTESDTIFKRIGDEIEGAWLQSYERSITTPMMSARLQTGDTVFSFPYPGYGLSGEGLDWTGRCFSNLDFQFDYLDEDTKRAVLQEYWSTTTEEVSTFNSISIGNTRLIDNGAYASKNYMEADQIVVRYNGVHDADPDSVYHGQQHYAWLYKMTSTDLPIVRGSNTLYWPMIRYDTNISYIAPSSQCLPTELSGIDIGRYMNGAVAGGSPEVADKIYKLDSAENGNVVGSMWLSGAPIKLTNITDSAVISGVQQPSLGFTIEGGGNAVFAWTDLDRGADCVFQGVPHQIDCDYLKEPRISLYNERIESNVVDIDYNQWRKCNCRAIMYSPFGHPGNSFDDYDGLSDYIVAINDPVSAFSLESWRDSEGLGYRDSDEFGWYKLDEPDELEPPKLDRWLHFLRSQENNGITHAITATDINFGDEFEIEYQGVPAMGDEYLLDSNSNCLYQTSIGRDVHPALGYNSLFTTQPVGNIHMIVQREGTAYDQTPSPLGLITIEKDACGTGFLMPFHQLDTYHGIRPHIQSNLFDGDSHNFKLRYNFGAWTVTQDDVIVSTLSSGDNYADNGGFGVQNFYISNSLEIHREHEQKLSKAKITTVNGVELELYPLSDGTMYDYVTETIFSNTDNTEPILTPKPFNPQIVQQQEPDAGWRSGRWFNSSGKPFILRENTLYMYVRSNLNRSKLNESGSSNSPYLTVRHSLDSSKYEWKGLDLNLKTNELVSNNQQLTLEAGNYLLYDHQDSISIALSSENITITEEPFFETPNFTDPVSITAQAKIPELGTQTIELSSLTDITYETGETDATGELIIGKPTVQTIIIPSLEFDKPVTVQGSVSSDEIWTITSGVTAVSSMNIHNINYDCPSTNFKIEVPLSGWNYDTSSYDGVSLGARPFWAQAIDDSKNQTKFKGIDFHGGSIELVDNYNFIQQPTISDITFNADMYIIYKRRGPTMIWYQPVIYSVITYDTRWNKLEINRNSSSPLSEKLLQVDQARELTVRELYEPSDMILDTNTDAPYQMNYYAISAFKWIQPVSDNSSDSRVWVDIVSGSLVTPAAPYANLSNRHYPTYASVPYIGGLYSEKESGGYFIPQMLGTSTFLTKRLTQSLTTDYIDTVNGNVLDRVFRDFNINETDYGLSRTDQIAPIITTSVDARWMKGAITEWSKAGSIVHAREHQEFIPYQAAFETRRFNSQGIRRQGDKYDPWYGPLDDEWDNVVDFPVNERQQFDIENWYEQFEIEDGRIYNWKTDIFGNQYALMKHSSRLSQYEKAQLLGSMWTRDARGVVKSGINSLTEIYNKFINLNIGSNIKNFDIWFDTIVFILPESLAIAKINFNYETGKIFAIADDIYQISLDGSRFAGTWLFEEEKSVTICTLASADDIGAVYFYPEIRKLDLETNILTLLYSPSANTDLMQVSSISLSTFEDPVFTYNPDTKQYNIAFIGYSHLSTGMYFTTIDIQQYGSEYEIIKVKSISPSI